MFGANNTNVSIILLDPFFIPETNKNNRKISKSMEKCSHNSKLKNKRFSILFSKY